MKKITGILLFGISLLLSFTYAQKSEPMKEKTALILIDIQEFYFPGGKLELTGCIPAARVAKSLLQWARENGVVVVHVMHQGGGNIRPEVEPSEGEKVIVKKEVNAFKGTDLKRYLDSLEVKRVILAGMQTHMCLEGATRAAADFDYNCFVVHDACATRDLVFNGIAVKAADVHASTLATLKTYAKVMSFEEIKESLDKN